MGKKHNFGSTPDGITVLSFFDRISVFHTLAPYLIGLHRRDWDGTPPRLTYTDSPEWCLNHDKNDFLIIERLFLKPPVTDIPLLEALRRRYRRIFFFNGNAGGAIQRPEVLPYVDRFYNKALFVDRSLYTKPLYGRELFTDFSHRRFNVVDDPEIPPSPAPEEQLDKVRLGWSIGVGDFPRRHFRQRVGVALSRLVSPRLAAPIIHKREITTPSPPSYAWTGSGDPGGADAIDVNARLGNPGYPTIAFHRQHLGAALREAAVRRGWSVVTDRVPIRRYFADMERSRITFSPFGWGELCFRDFEAVRAGSLLVKPDMSHLATWPDIYLPGETYVPVAWDGSDLEEKIAYYLGSPGESRRIAENAFEVYRRQLTELPVRVASVLRELVDG
jgi:hypothetical protein